MILLIRYEKVKNNYIENTLLLIRQIKYKIAMPYKKIVEKKIRTQK